MLYSLSGL